MAIILQTFHVPLFTTSVASLPASTSPGTKTVAGLPCPAAVKLLPELDFPGRYP
jgi:hypothetical protein